MTSFSEFPKLKENRMGDITLGISPACHLKIFLSFLLNCFPLPALVALLLTRWLVACTDRETRGAKSIKFIVIIAMIVLILIISGHN